MSRFNLRRVPRISYYEPEEPNLDEYVYCEKCGDYVFEYCSVHGPLLVIPDTKVPTKTGYPAFVPRASLTIPSVFLHIAPSIIPGAGLGVFSTLTLPRGVRFGPYRGKRLDEITSTYCWQLYDAKRKRRVVVDAADANSSNWMRYVNCARHWCEQNLIAYQYQGEIYYRTIKIIPKFTELMVFYGSEFANLLGVDLRKYNSPAGYAAKYGALPAKKNKVTHTIVQEKSTLTPKDKKIQEEPEERNRILQKNETTNCISFTPLKVENNVQNLDKNNLQCSKRNETNNNNVNNVNNNVQNFICNDCGKTFDNKSVLSKHVEHHNFMKSQVYFKCHLCKYIGFSSKSLETHIKIHNQEHTITENNELNTKNSQNENLKTHLLKHTGEKQFQCDICNKKFNLEGNLKRHILIHTGEKPFQCDICNKQFNDNSNLNKHILMHTGEKPFQCDICNKKFNQISNLKTHLLIHTGEKPFQCDICNKKFNRNGHLKKHILIHTGEKPFQCDICRKKFNRYDVLKTHFLIHTGEKPFQCDICRKKFNQNGSLKTHILIHTGEKPFQCDICNKKFNQNSSLKTHISIHTGEKPFQCDICNKKFNHNISLKTHILIHTGEKPFECTQCKNRYKHKISLKNHLKTHTVSQK